VGILNLAGTSTDCNTIQVTWTSPGDATSFDVYMDGVFLSNVATFVTQPLGLPTGNGPFSHEVYFVSRNECGAGDTSNVIDVAVQQAPTIPTNVAASDTSCGLVYVMWTASSGVVDGYTILEDGNVVGTTGPGVTTFSYDPGDSDVHQYTVFAFSTSCGVSPTSTADAGQKVAQPGVPTNLTFANNSRDSIRVSWTAATGSPASYVIIENGDSIASTTSLHFEYVPAGGPGTYDISVASYSTFCGTGTQTAPVAIVLYAQPTPVSGLTASDNRCDGVQLSWNPYVGINDGFIVYRNGSLLTTTAADAVGYFDAGATLGSNHYAVITLSNLTGCAESDSATTNGTVLPLPTVPTNVAATDTSCADVFVTWTASTGTFDGYIVYRDAVQIATVNAPATSYTDTGIPGGTTASYTVAAFDDICGTSSQSTGENGTRLEGPAAPTGVVATDNGCDQIDITWNVAPGDVTEYRVYRGGVFVSSVPSGTTSYTDAPAAGTYSYTVTAFSTNCGETAQSIADNGTRLPQMGQVVAISASVDSCEGILVTWEQMTGAVNYRVFKDAVFLAQVNAPTGEYMDFSVAEGVQHNYTVAAVNTCNEGVESNAVVGSRAATPTQVTGLTATTNLISQVCLNWADVAGELSYHIYRDAVLIATNSADDVDYCDITASPGTTYTYTVAAANVCGEGTISDGAQGSAVFSIGQVTGLSATTTDCAQICLTWTDINNETGYEILRNSTTLATVGAGIVTYCDLTAAPGECFTYTVRGFNVGGNGPLSAEVQGCRRNIPTQVTGLTATNTNCNAVVLNWNDATDEDRYDVYRDGALLVQNVGALTYTDNSAVAGVVYAYTILAVNACGNALQSVAVNGVRAMTPPQVTGGVASIDVCNQIGLNWSDQLSELGYRIYRDGNFLTPIATVGANTTSYVDPSIIGSHTYNIRAFNDCGNGNLSADIVGVGLTTPGVATGLSASNNCGDVTVTWTAPTTSPISEYHVLRNGTQVGVVLVGTTTFVDNNVPAGTYTYRVITNNVCGDGSQSAQSNSVTVIPALVQVPTFTATASSCFCIDVTWGNVINEDGYYLYCDGLIVDTLGANVTSTNYCPADTQSCVVQVAAFNACEIGPLSVGNSVTPNTYPAAVTGFSASENICDRVRLTWNAYNQPGVTRLKIRRDGVAIATLISGNTSFEQLGVWPQSAYSITALRVCAAGDTIEAPLATDNGRTAPTPVAPSQMAASDDGCGIVTVTFTFANVDGQDSVMVKRNGVVIARLAGGIPNVQRSFVDNSPLGATATYEVCPVSNLCGQGACASDLGQAAPTAGLVTDVTATIDRCTSILVEWTGTQFALNYQVRRNGTLINTVPQGQFSYTDNVATGTVNTYTVTATNACGSGPQSQPAQGSTIPLPPVPTGVSASDGLCNQVIVTWNEIGVATSYEVWRNNAFLADVPGGVEVYTDLAVTPGTNYNYQVRGVNQCGDGNLSAATTGFSAQVITTVTNVVATTNLNDRVRITWNNVPQETGYQILRGFPAEVIATVGIDVTSYNDFSAAPGEEYEYRVRAFNGCGEGELSAVTYGYRVPVDPIPFGVITVTEELFGCMSAVAQDMDNDGDADVVAAGMFADKVMWYENTGTWDYIPHVVVENWDGARSVAVGDIDDDGDMDIAAVAQFADQLVWFRHNANGTYTTFVINNNYDGARDVTIVDLDRDGDKDLVTAACDANDISWWRNNGTETFTRVVIDNNFVGARTVEVKDIGGDNDWDILASAYEGGMLAWFSNNGSQTFTRNVVMQDVYGASYINAARLNADNVLDIYFCVAQQPMIGWIDGATQAFHEVTTLVPFPREMDAVDMDQDNRADLLLAANENQEISWWRNTENRFYRNPITTSLTQASVVHGGDFDNDGDNDVLGAGEGTIKIWLSALSDDTHEAELAMPQDDGTDKPAYSQSIVPLNYELSSNYPNPFNPMTQIRFGLPEAQNVKLTVYDVTGREVARLVDGSFGAGYHTVTFDATNLASGLYLYRIEAGDFVSSRKMILMK
ncbi:MAG: VCBS repeat-containing protein, partial [bacterium]|nr:VCBS repeat-containing protein [bacterium]